MSDQRVWDSVDGYMCERLVPEDAALAAALEASKAAGLPAIQVSANQGKLLMLAARAAGAMRPLRVAAERRRPMRIRQQPCSIGPAKQGQVRAP